MLAGGCYSGQVVCWDTRSARSTTSHPNTRLPARRTNQTMTAPLAASHTEPVYCSKWTASKTGMEMMTSSEDGEVKWWDVRRLHAPLTQLDLASIARQSGEQVRPSRDRDMTSRA